MSLDRMTDQSDAPRSAQDAQRGDALPPSAMEVQAATAASFLKALSHEGRLMILCHLSTGEKTVTELEHLLDSRQAAVSQQLSRLRLDGLVSCRREGKAIHYAIHDPKVSRTIALMYEMFCKPGQD
ncbi:ArsR family transcriptional regulator [Pseudotabrizicola alkalilacus]|uniref:ArsR family transcriptional regulator n=2 Tax=Pseudotabrizicola alkalilacus TaxID=2305252 RepID=A0A411Z4D5_9RHOB|nr:ArsR family transcriptional regulator [Pseudotabrizicola alkalilacus]